MMRPTKLHSDIKRVAAHRLVQLLSFCFNPRIVGFKQIIKNADDAGFSKVSENADDADL